MAKLSAKEAKLLERLTAKAEAPDEPSSARTLNISIDLGDEKQVERATKLGLLGGLLDDDEDDDDDDDTDGKDEPPKRRGYFPGN